MLDVADTVVRMLSALPEQQRAGVVQRLLKSPMVAEVVDPQDVLRLLSQRIEPARKTAEPQKMEPVYPVKVGRERLVYDAPGTITGAIRGYHVSVIQLPNRNFRTIIDDVEYSRLSIDLVEGNLGLEVKRKRDGGNSETLARAIFRHLVDRYNNGDDDVTFRARAA